MENTTIKRRSSIKIMGKMIGLVKPLAHIMTAAVLLGTLGYLCAIFLTITAGKGLLLAMKGVKIKNYLIALVILAVMRGMLHYAEQYCNHFIAFKLLAIIRHKVFAALRKLCPAKLEGKEKGNLISIITTDIELLEVFYAHTESLRGIDETIQYGQGEKRKEQMSQKSIELGILQKDLNRMEAMQRAITNLVILTCSFGMFFLMFHLYQKGNVTFDQMILATIAMMGSFGPVTALSSLSNNLNQTLASGERVLSLLEETPMVEELEGEQSFDFEGASVCNVTFSYDKEVILKDCNINMEQGKVMISDQNIKEIPTKTLRNTQSYVTQETELFHDSIVNSIAIGKLGASREEIIQATKKASIHEMITSLPNGYDTEVGELGDTLSGGEKQRIGIARTFLHDAPMLLLDEPTSNLDSLNEGIILKSLEQESTGKTIVLVSHRESTMGIADKVINMEAGRVS